MKKVEKQKARLFLNGWLGDFEKSNHALPFWALYLKIQEAQNENYNEIRAKHIAARSALKEERKKLKKLKSKALKLVFWHYVAIEKALKFYIDSHPDKDPDKPQNLDIKTAKWDFANNFEAFSDNQELILNHIKTKAQKSANKHARSENE